MRYLTLSLIPALLLLITLSNVVHAKIYKWVDENGITQFSDNPADVPQTRVDKPSSERKKNQIQNKHLSVSKLKIRKLLRKREYQKLNEILADYQKRLDSNIKYERELIDIYHSFSVANNSLEPLLLNWVKKYPNSYQPLLACAFYYNRFGWESRGGAWAKDTSEEQMQNMRNYFSKAKTHINSVLSMRRHHLLAYYLLIDMAKAEGKRDALEDYRREILAYRPASLAIRSAYMESMSPRWGGTIREMEAYATESQKHINSNPKLAILKGYPYYAAGRELYSADNYTTALKLFSQALTYGDYAKFFSYRSDTFLKLEKYEEALNDINRAISIRPEDGSLYLDRYWVYRRLGDNTNALQDLESADLYSPYTRRITKQFNTMAKVFINEGYQHAKEKNFADAIHSYNVAIELDPSNAEGYSRKAHIYIDQRDYNAALEELEYAIELEPNEFSNYKWIDRILTKQSDWDQIISYWTRFLDLTSDNGYAYLARGVAHFRKGDIRSAKRDTRRSANLGHPDGIRIYRNLNTSGTL